MPFSIRSTEAARFADRLANPLELAPAKGRGGRARLVGTHQGISVEIEIARGVKPSLSCALDAPLPPGLWVTREEHGPLHRDSGRDLQLGDPVLDPLLHIECEHPAAAIRILRAPNVRERLAELFENHRRVHLIGPRLRISKLEDASVETVRVALGRMARLAAALSEAAREEEARHAENKAESRALAKSIEARPKPKRAPKPEVAASPPAGLWVERAYAKRARQSLIWICLPSVGLFAMWTHARPSAAPWEWCIPIGIAVALSWWRNICPSCERRFMLRNKYWDGICPHCGVALRSSSMFWPFWIR